MSVGVKKGLFAFFKEWMNGWRKIHWPSRQDLFHGWVTVMVSLFVGGAVVRGIDICMKLLVRLVFKLCCS